MPMPMPDRDDSTHHDLDMDALESVESIESPESLAPPQVSPPDAPGRSMSEAELAVWERTPHAGWSPPQLDMLHAYCRSVAMADRLTATIAEWSDMDPVSELSTLIALRAREVQTANMLRRSLPAGDVLAL